MWQHGRDLLVLLKAQPGERMLDVGCGTGPLTAEIMQFATSNGDDWNWNRPRTTLLTLATS